jgi:catechol 2,3-dioxygenase-like lactoylglutathione lyase family enzyme
MPITFSHPHIRIRDIAETLDFYCDKLGLVETTRNTQGKLTLIYLAAPADMDRADGAPTAAASRTSPSMSTIWSRPAPGLAQEASRSPCSPSPAAMPMWSRRTG